MTVNLYLNVSFDVHTLAILFLCYCQLVHAPASAGQLRQLPNWLCCICSGQCITCCQHFSWCNPLKSQVWSCAPLQPFRISPKASRMKIKTSGVDASPTSSCTTFSFFLLSATADLMPSYQSSILLLILRSLPMLEHKSSPSPMPPSAFRSEPIPQGSLSCRQVPSLQAHEHPELLFTPFDDCLISPQMCKLPKDRFCLFYYLLYLQHGAHFLACSWYLINACSGDRLHRWLYPSSL